MKAKLGAIFLVSVLAIAGAGAAYALWFEDLYIYTDIYTGDVDVEWSLGQIVIVQDKEVSWATGEIIDGNRLYYKIFNAYPCVDYIFNFDVHCIGSIPVHFTPFDMSGSLDDSYIQSWGIYIDRINDADGNLIIDFEIPELIQYIQLHEGETAYGFYYIHFNNDLPQDDFFTFDLHSQAHQYNELNWGPGAKP